MKFDLLQFLIFLPIVLILYRIFPQKLRWFVLLCASCVFFAYYTPSLTLLLLAISLVTYVFARKTYSAYERVMKKVYTAIPIVLICALLFVFKYFNFVVGGFSNLLSSIGIGLGDFSINIIVPVGISFLTLRAISYLVDVYRGKIKPEKHFGYLALYIFFFPIMLAGPIERADSLIPQLKAKKPFAGYDAAFGLKMLACGFFKKVALSNQIAVYVDTVFASSDSVNLQLINGFTVLLASVMLVIQIYCDFSGYYDIALGCAALMGIKLTKNFDAPFSALGVRDLHNRWNITLNDFLRDYIYLPIAGSEPSKVRYYLTLALVFLLYGLWYGSGWSFVLFGAVHFAVRVIAELTENSRAKMRKRLGSKADGILIRGAKRLMIFAYIMLSVMIMRAENLRVFGRLMAKIFAGWSGFTFSGALSALGMTPLTLATVILTIYVVSLLDKQIVNKNELSLGEPLKAERGQAYVTVCWAILFAWILLLVSGEIGAFAYFVF